MEVRLFGRASEVLGVPNLIEIQTKSYEDFLQTDVPGEKRKNQGLEALLREIFPIDSYDGKYSLEYLKYELGKPLYSIDQCRQLRLTYGRPFRIWVRLNKEQPIEEEVYLGELPIMIGGGEFVINGAERVIVSQLHRSPGVDFMVDTESGDRRLHAARIIPERGSWVEMNVTKRDVLVVRIDQSGKFPVTMFLRAMSEKHSDDASIIRAFYKTATVKVSGSRSFQPLQGKYLVSDVVNEATGEVVLEGGSEINELTFASMLDALLNIGGQAKRVEDKVGDSQLSDLKDVFRFVPESDLLSYENRSKFPKEEGVYGWYMDELPPGVPKEGCTRLGKWTLLYVGLTDKPLKTRLNQHFTGNAEASTLRLSIGALRGLKCETAKSHKFNKEDESQTAEWLKQHARVAVITNSAIKAAGSTGESLEGQLIDEYCLPLNIDKGDHPFITVLSMSRERAAGGEEVNVLEEWGKVKHTPEWHDYKELHEKKEAAAEKRRLGRKADEERHHRDREAERLNLRKGQECEVEVIDEKQIDPLILNTVRDDPADSQESALLRIYARLRPGNPPQIEKAKDLFKEKFFDANRYRLGGVGRFRMNRKFGTKVSEDEQTLKADDIINCIRYVLGLRKGEGRIDDIDHLGNRRVRTISELAADEIRKGFLKLRRTIQERMSLGDQAEMTPRTLVNSKTISSSIDYFFGRGELSQVVDQTNPLSQLAHERRLSALGPGGLNRKRAGFEVRDVHISHYGRICPIETPEGSNIGLISNLSIFSRVDDYGFLITPYRVVKNGKITSETVFLRADQEEDHYIAPADQDFANETILARLNGDFLAVDRKKVQYVDLSARQLVGVSAGLIPFLEHDDANRALMGSNMQRQAVPLVRCEPPIVATGLEGDVPQYSGMVVTADADGTVTKVTADEIIIGDRTYRLRKFVGLNERTCLNQKPIAKMGEKVKKKQVIADGAATKDGQLALGRNILVGFMPWDGYNFEDAILVNERLVEEDAYTSIHIEEFEVEIRETKLGREEFTRDIPNVSERELANLDEHGIIRVGTLVKPGDILVGKIAPKSKSELTPEEKLLQAIFGRAGEDVKNDSLEVPAGIEGIVIHTERFQRKVHLSDIERLETENLVRIKTEEYDEKKAERLRAALEGIEELVGGRIPLAGKKRSLSKVKATGQKKMIELVQKLKYEELDIEGGKTGKAADALWKRYVRERDELADECEREVGRIRRGDKLPSGVLELGKVYVATKRVLSVGDKMAGRHGNKGVIAKILSTEDMPFLADGTPLDIVLNPLGVPSRMNVGQILETHLGWAAKVLGFTAVCPVFDGATESEIHDAIREANRKGGGWIPCDTVEAREAAIEELSGKHDKQGVYFFRNAISGRVNEGYIGLAGTGETQMLRNRMRLHFVADPSADNMLKGYGDEEERLGRGPAEDEPREEWVKRNYKEWRKDYLSGFLTSFKYVVTEDKEGNRLSKDDLEALETKLLLTCPDKEPRDTKRKKGKQAFLPRFNGWNSERDLETVKRDVRDAFARNPRLQTLFDECVRAIESQRSAVEMPEDGKVVLYDGRTGDSFTQKVTVGYIYMMKLHHLVDDKVHARATGPYSLITQQPLGGKARSGGQRFGEMEVWALEAYGAAHVLQEILTVKSDDVEGRTKIYESMIKGENTLEAGTPVSFEVLTNEIKGLCLNMELLKRRVAI